MKTHIVALITVILVGCNKPDESAGTISAFSTGLGHPDRSSSVIQSYGSHAIRIDNGSAKVRVYKVKMGQKFLEHEFVLDSKRHQMAWVTPSIVDAKVQFEFGMVESSEGQGGTPHYYSTFGLPKSVGSGVKAKSVSATNEEAELLHYVIVNDKSVSIPFRETTTIPGLLRLSEGGLVEFYLVTAATK